jgi:hypothetical protein
MTSHYILITTDDEREQVFNYSAAEMAEIYSADERAELQEGRAIFRNGALHTDMLQAARAVTADALING